MNYLEVYEQCAIIRRFERKVESEFGKGNMRGTTHGCIGQEIIPVLAMEHIDRLVDYVVGTHRCHGQVLAYEMKPYNLFCEMMGRKDGFVEGMGGSQHIKVGRYLTNGITGGMAVVGNGIAMSMKKNGKPGIVVSYIGDGGFNEGYVQEALNLAACYQSPILYICENNHYAMSTPTQQYCSGNFASRIMAYDMGYAEACTSDIDSLDRNVTDAFYYVRTEKKPFFLDIQTARLCGHSKSDKMEYMTEAEKEKNSRNDPLRQLRARLTEEEYGAIDARVEELITDAYIKALTCEEKNKEEI